MLKLSNTQVDNKIVRPYIVLIYLLSELDYLSQDEFTYLLPLCVNKTTTLNILSNIKLLRNNETDINDDEVEVKEINKEINHFASYL